MDGNMLDEIGTYSFSDKQRKKKYIYMVRKNAAIAAIAATTGIALLMPPQLELPPSVISAVAAICKFCDAVYKLTLPPI